MSVSELPAGYHFQGVSVQHMDCGGKVGGRTGGPLTGPGLECCDDGCVAA